MSVLTEKDPTFIQDTRIEGNLSVVEHPNDASYYGDGSVEIGGTLSVDIMKSATPGSVMIVKSPFCHKIFANRPVPPIPGTTQIFADGDSNGRIVMMDADGKTIDLNPLSTIGDIMTFDGIKNTTTRLPTGLPGQKLSCEPGLNFSSRLAWKEDFANVHSVSEPSDGYMRYAEALNTQTLDIINAPQHLLTDHSVRADADTFSVATSGAGGILVLQPGVYEINVNLNVSFDPEKVKSTSLATGDIVPVETYLDSGFIIVPGSRNWHNVTYVENSHTESSQSISTRMILYFPTNTRVRIFAQESEGSNTGVLRIKPFCANISIIKLNWKNNSAEYLSVVGLQGSRPPLGSVFTTIPTTTVVYQTNNSDIIGSNSITLDNGGYRHISAKFAFEKYNVNTDLNAVIECRVLLNGTPVINGIARCSLIGSIGSVSTCVNTIASVSAGDVLSIDARIFSGNLTSGGIMIFSEQCILTLSMPNTDQWKICAFHSDSIHNMNASGYTPIDFNVTERVDIDTFSKTNENFTFLTGGTYQYLVSLDLQNVDSTACTALSRLQLNSGDGWQPVQSSISYSVLAAGAIQTHYCSATVYVPPNSKVRYESLLPDGGSVQVLDDSAHLWISKYENTSAPLTGLPDFGRFYYYINDDDEVLTTSTVFSNRLTFQTSHIPMGKYRFGISYEWDLNAAGIGFETKVVLDGTGIIESYDTVPLVTGVYSQVTSFQQLDLQSGEHTFSFDTKVLESTRSLHTRNVRMELWKL